MKINFLSKGSFLALLFLLISCDFTSSTSKDILLAQKKIKEQKFNEAAFYYEKVLEKSLPPIVRTKIEYQLADLYSIYLKDYDKALDHFDKLLEVNNEPLWKVRSLEKKANIYFNFINNFEKSAEIYQTLMSFRPKLKSYDEYEYLLARSLIKKNKFKDAVKVLKNIRGNKNHDFYVRSFYDMGLVYFYQKKWSRAIQSWFSYIKRESIKDKVVEAKFMMANAYESNEELRRAYQLYSDIKSDYPNREIIESRLEALYKRRVVRKR